MERPIVLGLRFWQSSLLTRQHAHESTEPIE
jgi:hypothetical protein